MSLNNIDKVKKLKPFIDAINTNGKINAKIIIGEDKNIYWNHSKNDWCGDVIELNLKIDLDKYETNILYVPSRILSNIDLTLDIKIKTNAKKIVFKEIYKKYKREYGNFYDIYDYNNPYNSGEYEKQVYCQNLKLEGFKPNSIRAVDVKGFFELNVLDLSNNESLIQLKCGKNRIHIININNTKRIKKLDCVSFTIYAENSKLEEIINRRTVLSNIFASNSNLKTINKHTQGICLQSLHVKNTLLEYINISTPEMLINLNIKNTKLPEKIKKELIFSIIEKNNPLFLECDEQVVFYNKGNIKYSVCKYDMDFKVLDNSNNDKKYNIYDLNNLKNNFIENFQNLEKAEIEYKKAIELYNKITKNTNLIMGLVRRIFLSKENSINEIISKCSKEEINQRNIYDKSAICYVYSFEIFQNLIKSGYKIIEKDLPHLIKTKNQNIISFTENLIIKNSIMEESPQKIKVKKKNINKNIL